jgi:feruloyl esterase
MRAALSTAALVAALLSAPPVLSAAAPSVLTADAPSSSRCEALQRLQPAGYQITAATHIEPAPRWVSPAIYGRTATVAAAFCRVEGMIENRIGFEFWLPEPDAWNGRLLGAGVGGDAGVYNYHDSARGVEAGYATISNDSGHKASETHWMMRTEAVLDYTLRAQHLMNLTARDILQKYYARAPHHAYFLGCSGGGRQALKEMQRYPGDYDGVIAGAAAPTMPIMSARHLWQALYQQQNPNGAMSDADWDIVAKAAVAKCDRHDGVIDGVVENPALCKFNVASVGCRSGQAKACLKPAQLTTVRRFMAPLRDETGVVLDDGLVPGARTRPGAPSPLLLPFFGEGGHQSTEWSAAQFNMHDDLALVERMMPEMRADLTQLDDFVNRGGRGILYQGWLDPSVVAGQSTSYFDRVRKQMGAARTTESMRLYMVPGMLHCRGGDGVDQFGGAGDLRPVGDASHDLLSALTEWVEQGKAPTGIVGVKLQDSNIKRERLLCPYPTQAHFLGGNADDASRYQCRAGVR